MDHSGKRGFQMIIDFAFKVSPAAKLAHNAEGNESLLKYIGVIALKKVKESEIFSGTLDVFPFVIMIFGFILLGQSVFFHHPGKPG